MCHSFISKSGSLHQAPDPYSDGVNIKEIFQTISTF